MKRRQNAVTRNGIECPCASELKSSTGIALNAGVRFRHILAHGEIEMLASFTAPPPLLTRRR